MKNIGSNLTRKRNDAISKARKATDRGNLEKALNHYREASRIHPSDKLDKVMFNLEEKVIKQLFPKEYPLLSSHVFDEKHKNIFNTMDTRFPLWPLHKKTTSLLEKSHWEPLDNLFPKTKPHLLDQVLSGRYYLEKRRFWDAFLLLRPLIDLPDEKRKNIEQSEIDRLREGLNVLFNGRPLPLLEKLDSRVLKSGFSLCSKKTGKAMVHGHLAWLIYESLWKKADRFLREISGKHQNVSWSDQTTNILRLNILFWQTLSSHDHLIDEVLMKIKKSNLGSGIDEDGKKILVNNLDDLVKAWRTKDNTHWSTLCRRNPYRLMGMQTHGEEGLSSSFAKAIAHKDEELQTLLLVQRLLRNKNLRNTLKFLFLPMDL